MYGEKGPMGGYGGLWENGKTPIFETHAHARASRWQKTGNVRGKLPNGGHGGLWEWALGNCG